jgi:hypothetical protein
LAVSIQGRSTDLKCLGNSIDRWCMNGKHRWSGGGGGAKCWRKFSRMECVKLRVKTRSVTEQNSLWFPYTLNVGEQAKVYDDTWWSDIYIYKQTRQLGKPRQALHDLGDTSEVKWSGLKQWDCCVGFEVLSAVFLKISIFWSVTLCSPLKLSRLSD